VRADDSATLRNHGAVRREDVDGLREDVSAWGKDVSAWGEDGSAFVESLSARRAHRSVFAEALSKCFDGRLGIRGRPLRARPGPVARGRGTLLVPSGPLGAARVPVRLWTEPLPMARGRLGTRGRTSRRTESACTETERISPKGERIDRHSGDVLSLHRAVRFECGEALLEGREALSRHREALCQGRAVLQPYRAVLSPFRDDRSPFRDDRAASVVSVSSTWRA
jgi:hypothetical protein